jgi:hypothetical protein
MNPMGKKKLLVSVAGGYNPLFEFPPDAAAVELKIDTPPKSLVLAS